MGSGLLNNNVTLKHDIGQSVKSVAITCNNEVLVLGAMRKILFKPIQAILEGKQGKLYERSMSVLGQNQSMSSLEVQ